MLTKCLDLFGLRRKRYTFGLFPDEGAARKIANIHSYKIHNHCVVARASGGKRIVFPFAHYKLIEIYGGGLSKTIAFPREDGKVEGSF